MTPGIWFDWFKQAQLMLCSQHESNKDQYIHSAVRVAADQLSVLYNEIIPSNLISPTNIY